MGFFSDLKEDLSQAVNELIPEDSLVTEDEEVKNEDVTISLDEMLANIDSIKLPEGSEEDSLQGEVTDGTDHDDLSQLVDALNLADQDNESSEADVEASEDALIEFDGIELENVKTVEEALSYSLSADAEVAKEAEELIAEPVLDESDEIKTEAKADEEALMEELFPINAVAADTASDELVSDLGETDKGVIEKMDNNEARIAVDETSIITAGMLISGDIFSEGSLEVVGSVAGNIDVYGKLSITGKIEGNSRAAEVFADGAQISGKIESDGAVKIGASTVIVGDIFASSAVIAGAVKGDIDVKGPVVLDTSAIVMGNVKSKAIQINNGAVIEGNCSQCYADVNPTSFFDDYRFDTKKSK